MGEGKANLTSGPHRQWNGTEIVTICDVQVYIHHGDQGVGHAPMPGLTSSQWAGLVDEAQESWAAFSVRAASLWGTAFTGLPFATREECWHIVAGG